MEIPEFLDKYISEFSGLIQKIKVTQDTSNEKINFYDGIRLAVDLIRDIANKNGKIIFIGNGGSAAIASHQAIDFWNNGGVQAITFNDSSLLTCMANDYGYPEVFSKPMEMFANEDDLAICISSSGSSQNIINATNAARKKGTKVITFSAFEDDNPLRSKGDMNFYLPSFSYGMVEILHLFIIHLILDTKMYCFDGKDVFYRNQQIKDQIE